MKTRQPQKQYYDCESKFGIKTKICRFKQNYPPQNLTSNEILMETFIEIEKSQATAA